MKSIAGSRVSISLLVAALSGTACKRNETAVVRVDGSSTVFPISEAVAEEFQRSRGGARVTVGVSGTGGGFKKLCRREVDIANGSRPIKPSEVDLCKEGGVEYVEVPIAYDGIAVVVNPKNDWVDHITVEELAKLWQPEGQGTIQRWNQIRPDWPDREIHLFGAGVDSGTYDYFTAAVVGREHASRGDFTSSEDDNVLVQGIATDEVALGFFGFAYYHENRQRLKVVGVDDQNPKNGDGPIEPSVDTIRSGTYQPLSRPIFIYVAKASLDRPEVAAFVEFYLNNAGKLASEVGYVPLPGKVYGLAKERVAARKTGSIFGGEGSQVGVSIEALLEREGS